MYGDDLEQRMKDKLLEGLIEHMEDRMGDDLSSKFPSAKPMEVSVAAPDKEGLADGLDKAKDITSQIPSGDDGSDEDRLMQLLGEDDEDDKGL